MIQSCQDPNILISALLTWASVVALAFLVVLSVGKARGNEAVASFGLVGGLWWACWVGVLLVLGVGLVPSCQAPWVLSSASVIVGWVSIWDANMARVSK